VIDFSTPSQLGQKMINSREERTVRKDSGTIPASRNNINSHYHRESASERARELRNISLRGRSHVSIKDARFSLTKSHRRQPIARDWSPQRKRFVAAVACISTALIGVLVGIYAGIVPSVQYYIADFDHYAILGNVGMYLGMSLPTFLCWPLPLLHGRKPYILSSLTLAMPMLFPQAIAVSAPRSPYTSAWRWALLLPRAFMGICLGFASMNFHSILTDLFGASLMSGKPHQEVVDEYDVRRHGGGLGAWLGIWTWCFIGSLSVGFLVGAVVIDTLPPSWGLYISIILIAVVLMLNVLTPEVRRSAWRRSVAEVRTGDKVSRRVARGEIMMHRVKDGPKWWGQELWHGAALSLEMLRQPGFVVMAIYSAWIYAQVVLIIVVRHPRPCPLCSSLTVFSFSDH
jgi:MFS family permease